MTIRKLYLTTAAIALTACAAPKSGTTDSAAGAAPASGTSADSPRATGATTGTRNASDSVGRSPIDTARVGKDTGRQSQNPNKQP